MNTGDKAYKRTRGICPFLEEVYGAHEMTLLPQQLACPETPSRIQGSPASAQPSPLQPGGPSSGRGGGASLRERWSGGDAVRGGWGRGNDGEEPLPGNGRPRSCCRPPSGQPRTFREAAAGLLGAPGLRSSHLASGLWFPSSCFRCGGRKFAGGGRARSRPATRSCFPATWKGPLGTTESREPLPHLPTHPSMPGVKAVRAARAGGSTLVYV